MEIIRYPQYRALKSVNNAVTIGNFDGVHLGHQALIKKVVKQAKQTGGLSVVVTMHPLPVQFFKGRNALELVSDFKQKARLMSELGVDVLCVLNFNQSLAAMPANDFFQKIIQSGLNTSYLLVGDDFKFGANRSGDADFLRHHCQVAGIVFDQQHSVMVSGHRVSSSLVREVIRQGDFAAAKTFLGREYVVSGRVKHGKKLGRTLGFPTLNLHFKQGASALHGIYVVAVNIDNTWHRAVASVGFNPTVKDQSKRLEVHVLDFDQNVYGEWIEVLFYQKLRNEVEFDGLSALKSAIAQDVKAARQYFEENTGELV